MMTGVTGKELSMKPKVAPTLKLRLAPEANFSKNRGKLA